MWDWLLDLILLQSNLNPRIDKGTRGKTEKKNQSCQNDWQSQQRGGRWLWDVNGGVRAATGKGHPIPEMDQKEQTQGMRNFTQYQNKCLKNVLILHKSDHCTKVITGNTPGKLIEAPTRNWCVVWQHWCIAMLPHPSCVLLHRTDFRSSAQEKILDLDEFECLNEMHAG